MKNLIRIDSTYPIDNLLQFCNHSLGDLRPGAVNMNPVNWENNPASFLYLLYIEKRYDGAGNGYLIYLQDGQIVSGGGFSQSDIAPYMSHLSSRSYTIPNIRLPLVHGAIHDMSIDISKDEGRAGAFSSVNEYNLRFLSGYLKLNDPKNYSTYHFKDGKHYSKPGIRIHPMKSAGPLLLKDTKQWIGYMIWDESYRKDFEERIKKLDFLENSID